jgi:hypothetical protein
VPLMAISMRPCMFEIGCCGGRSGDGSSVPDHRMLFAWTPSSTSELSVSFQSDRRRRTAPIIASVSSCRFVGVPLGALARLIRIT